MTFVAPFDGSRLSRAALVRADEYATALDEAVTAISVVPASRRYAIEKGWIAEDEDFDARAVVSDLHRAAAKLAPGASFRGERIDGAAREGTIAKRIRKRAVEEDASVVFVGSENAGRIVVSVTSVAGSVAADESYDVHIVRRRAPPAVDSLRRPKSDFYRPG